MGGGMLLSVNGQWSGVSPYSVLSSAYGTLTAINLPAPGRWAEIVLDHSL